MKRKTRSGFGLKHFLSKFGKGMTIADYGKKHKIFSQGDQAEAVFYIRAGKIKLSVISREGKEAVIGLLGEGDFFGEGCLAGQTRRMATASAMTECSIVQLQKSAIIQALRDDPIFAEKFLAHLLSRNIRFEEDLVDQLFNSTEKRLARVLLLMAHFGKEGKPELIIPKVSQAMLAEIIGATRSRVSFFMNKFRKMGFIEYNHGLEVHSSLLNVVLYDGPTPAGSASNRSK